MANRFPKDFWVDEKGKVFTTKVRKDTLLALLHLPDQVIVGRVYISRQRRLKDELNESRESFIAVSHARVFNEAGKLLYRSEFLLVNKGHILSITPLEDNDVMAESPWIQGLMDADTAQ